MKTIPAGLVDCATLVFGVRIVRTDTTVLGLTDHDKDKTVTVDGVSTLLEASPGFSIENLVSTAGLGVDNTEIQVESGTDITRADILARIWDGARVYFFRFNWKDPAAGTIPVKRGSFGNFKPKLDHFVVEFRDLRQALQPNSTWVFQEACRWRLGDARCAKNLTAFTFTTAVTTATSNTVFTASALTQAADYFGEGFVDFTSGLNAATPGFKVKSFTGGVVTLSEGAIYPIQVGNAFTIIAGCRKRWDLDCRDKFDNLLNFGGEKDKPTRDQLIRPAE